MENNRFVLQISKENSNNLNSEMTGEYTIGIYGANDAQTVAAIRYTKIDCDEFSNALRTVE